MWVWFVSRIVNIQHDVILLIKNSFDFIINLFSGDKKVCYNLVFQQNVYKKNNEETKMKNHYKYHETDIYKIGQANQDVLSDVRLILLWNYFQGLSNVKLLLGYIPIKSY